LFFLAGEGRRLALRSLNAALAACPIGFDNNNKMIAAASEAIEALSRATRAGKLADDRQMPASD
jgi:hypothetical protein